MILQSLSAESKESYLSVLDSYKKMRQEFVEYAMTFADYSDVYSILSESALYKNRKKYEVSVDGHVSLFEAPLWFDRNKLDMLKNYQNVGRKFYSLYLHIVWDRDEDCHKREHRVKILNPPNIAELIMDDLNSPEFNFVLAEDMIKYFGRMPKDSEEYALALKKVNDAHIEKSKKEPKRVSWVEEDLKRSFHAKEIKTLSQLLKKKSKLSSLDIEVNLETNGYIEIIGSLDNLHQAEWMLNQKLYAPCGEPLDVIIPHEKTYAPMPWKRSFYEKNIESYHFRLNQVFSILERKSKSLLDTLDSVDKNALSIAAESDASRFLDFLKEQPKILMESKEMEKELLSLYFPSE